MFIALFYWIGLPMLVGALLIRWLDKTAPRLPGLDVRDLFDRRPIERRHFRAARRDAGGLTFLGDFENQPLAVEAAYAGRERAQAAAEKAAFLVFNDKAELLEQIDS
jgi:hypothetical protein